jgi:putative ABC transport system permease protein
VIRAAWRDVIFRRRRFAIAIVATALVFALSLLLSGVSASFAQEADRTVRDVGGDAWIVRDGSPGPFTSFVPIRAEWADQLTGGGVVAARAMLVAHQVVRRTNHAGRLESDSPFRDVTLFGVDPVGLGAPRVVDGHGIEGSSDAVVDRRLGYDLGDQFPIGSRVVTVVGHTRGATLFAGLANVYVSLDTAQAAFPGLGNTGLIANTIVVKGAISAPVTAREDGAPGPVTLKLLTLRDVRDDVLRPLEGAQRTIDLVRLLLWIVAGCIVASIIYVTALERTRDFAVFKATGTATSHIFAGLVAQALLLAVGAGLASVVVASGLSRVFPIPVAVPTSSYVLLAVLAVVVGVLASLAGVRRVVSVDPATAFVGA